jgi:hypothetical protein
MARSSHHTTSLAVSLLGSALTFVPSCNGFRFDEPPVAVITSEVIDVPIDPMEDTYLDNFSSSEANGSNGNDNDMLMRSPPGTSELLPLQRR